MKYDYLNAGLFPAALTAFRANLPLMIGTAALLLAFDILSYFMEFSTGSVLVGLFLNISVAFTIHRTVLEGHETTWSNLIGRQHRAYSGFLGRAATFFAVFLVINVPVVMSAGLFNLQGPQVIGFAVIMLLLVGFPVFGYVLSLYGTLLPATVLGDDNSVRAAKTRGQPRIRQTFGMMIFGPALFVLLKFYALFLPIGIVSAEGMFQPLGILLTFAISFVMLFLPTLVAVVLCKAYLASK